MLQKLDFSKAGTWSLVEEFSAPENFEFSVEAGISACDSARAQDKAMAVESVQKLAADIAAHVFDELLSIA